MAVGLSLYDRSIRIHFSRGHLSRVENNMATPSATLVRLADEAVNADGRLIAFPEKRMDPDHSAADAGDEVSTAVMDPQLGTWFAPVAREHALAWSAGPARGFRSG
jgi:hypothetical protein